MIFNNLAIYFTGEIQFESNNTEALLGPLGVGSVSFLIAALGYALLSIILLIGLARRSSGKTLLFTAVVTTVWNAVLSYQNHVDSEPLFFFAHFLEVIRDGAWLLVLIRALADDSSNDIQDMLKHKYVMAAIIMTAFLAIITAIQPFLVPDSMLAVVTSRLMIYGFLGISLTGLVLTEQVLRNTLPYNLWQMKFFCLSIGSIFLYDFILYSEAALFWELDSKLWKARGLANAIIIPLIIIGASRTSERQINLSLSRNFVFRSSVLVMSGIYLIIMATAGYYIQTFEGNWAEVIQAVFIFGAIMSLAILLFSGNARSRLLVFINKNFFPYQYDYRHEWLHLTQQLTANREDPQYNLYDQAIRTLGNILETEVGTLWLVNEDGDYPVKRTLSLPFNASHTIKKHSSILQFLHQSEWIIDLDEYRQDPKKYPELVLPQWLEETENTWVVIPLLHQEELLGVIVLARSRAQMQLNWEHFDLLKVAARQVVGYIAQERTAQALAHAQQFQAYNQMSAFLVHDLKTMVAQLSLMVTNAHKHKDNPEFVEDMIKTTEHSVKKMTHLLHQLKAGTTTQIQKLNLYEILQLMIDKHRLRRPYPQLLSCDTNIYVDCDKGKLTDALGHLIQNAQDASGSDDIITINVTTNGSMVEIEITDTGCGMSDEFVREQLFKPFESTKGVSGMGIGVFQCREYIREMHGDIKVKSELAVGTSFTLSLPISNG